jgi:putative FmdB family regulatory protein
MLQEDSRGSLRLPLYEYECPKCGTFELVRKFSDAPLESCPTCARPVEKLASAPAIQFKGTGWYITDYARKSSGGEGGKDKGGAGDAARDKGEPSAAKGGDRAKGGGGAKDGGAKESTSGTAKSSERK